MPAGGNRIYIHTFPRGGARATYDRSDSASPRITGTETGNPTPDPINGILEDGRGRAQRVALRNAITNERMYVSNGIVSRGEAENASRLSSKLRERLDLGAAGSLNDLISDDLHAKMSHEPDPRQRRPITSINFGRAPITLYSLVSRASRTDLS